MRQIYPGHDLFDQMRLINLKAVVQSDLKFYYLSHCAFSLLVFLRTMVIGPTALQTIGGKPVYTPKFGDMSPSEQAIIDWCKGYVFELDRIASERSS